MKIGLIFLEVKNWAQNKLTDVVVNSNLPKSGDIDFWHWTVDLFVLV